MLLKTVKTDQNAISCTEVNFERFLFSNGLKITTHKKRRQVLQYFEQHYKMLCGYQGYLTDYPGTP